MSEEIQFDSDGSILSNTVVKDVGDNKARLELTLPDGHMIHTEDMAPGQLKEALKGKSLQLWISNVRNVWEERQRAPKRKPPGEVVPVPQPVVPVDDPAAWIDAKVKEATELLDGATVRLEAAREAHLKARQNHGKWTRLKQSYQGADHGEEQVSDGGNGVQNSAG